MATSSAAIPASASYGQQTAAPASILAGLQLVVGFALLAGLSVLLLMAEPGPLSSDESGYLAEGLNLALGKGYADAASEAVVDRAPLFPAFLAADSTVAGFSLDHARWIPRLFVLGSAALLLALGWRLFGREIGLLAATAALVSSFLMSMGTSLFPGVVQTFFLLLTLLLLHTALMKGKPRWAVLAGVSLGLAALAKESALLWFPLPFLAVLLLGPAISRPRALLVAYGLGFLAVAGWWWPYVYAVSGDVYLLGAPSGAVVWLVAGAGFLALAFLAAASGGRRRGRRLRPWFRWLLASVLLVAWGALVLTGLEQHADGPFQSDYLLSVPEYVAGALVSSLRPLPIIALAWGYVAYRAVRGSLGDRLLLLGLLLFLPFALFVASRDLPARELLPLVYLSYLALGRAAVDFGRWLGEALAETLKPAAAAGLAGLVVLAALGWFAGTEMQRFADGRASFDPAAVRLEHWDNPLVRATASWLDENVAPGTPIMSGRLYSSQLYALTGGRYRWSQLPTVQVEFPGSPPALVRAGATAGDEGVPASQAAQSWLYLRRHPQRQDFLALSEHELLAELIVQDIGYLIVTGDDAGFSSLSFVPYFEDHPAFRKVKAFVSDDANQAHIFEVLPSRLQSTSPPARVSRETADTLQEELGPKQAHDLLVGLSPGGYLITDSYGTGPMLGDSGEAGAEE